RSGSNIVAHLATKRRALTLRRSTVRALRRRAETALLLRRRETLTGRAEGGSDDRRPANVAKLVRRLRDRAALRTGVHDLQISGNAGLPRANRSISENETKAE